MITTEPRKDHIPPGHIISGSARPTVQHLTLMVQQLDITEKQKDKLEEFLNQREKIGDLANDDLTVEGELGSGNGGVVLKVRHKKTGTVMAKKVETLKYS
jgi:mitogen-activated protein kinase kinase 1